MEPCRDELTAAGITIIYYDEALFATFHDDTPIPKSCKFDPAPYRKSACLTRSSGCWQKVRRCQELDLHIRYNRLTQGRDIAHRACEEHRPKHGNAAEADAQGQVLYVPPSVPRRRTGAVYRTGHFCGIRHDPRPQVLPQDILARSICQWSQSSTVRG